MRASFRSQLAQIGEYADALAPQGVCVLVEPLRAIGLGQ
jgi:hypothetical protein